MKAMILAAGRGERMRPLTDTLPKPLLKVGGYSLIEHHICNLREIGVTEIVINTGWLAEKIHMHLGDGTRLDVKITYSDEGYPSLETAGGIINALSILGDAPFIVVNGDIFCDFDFSNLILPSGFLAHLILVPNPTQHNKGDFALSNGKICMANLGTTYTFSGIALYQPEFFEGLNTKHRTLRPVFDKAIEAGHMSGQTYEGMWHDVGTPGRLEALRHTYN